MSGIVRGDLLDGLHVAEGGAEDQLVALAGHVAQHALGVSRLSGTLSTKLVTTLSPNSFSMALRPLSCAKDQPPSPTGPT
jgi:hypothetical protein